jgi:hypothetical protein
MDAQEIELWGSVFGPAPVELKDNAMGPELTPCVMSQFWRNGMAKSLLLAALQTGVCSRIRRFETRCLFGASRV